MAKLVLALLLGATWLSVSIGAQQTPVGALEAARAANNPVVFVHGICSDNKTWESSDLSFALAVRGWKSGGALTDPFRPVFSAEASPDYYTVKFPDPYILPGIQSWAVDLRAYLRKIAADRIAKGLGEPQFTIVAHSAGGLAARAYLQSSDYVDDVKSMTNRLGVWHLITYGTPHLGAPIANIQAYVRYIGAAVPAFANCVEPVFLGLSVGLKDMQEGSAFLRALNEGVSPLHPANDVNYTSLIGRYEACLTSVPPLPGMLEPSDCIVSTRSQDIRSISNPPDLVKAYQTPSARTHLTETSDATSILFAIDRLPDAFGSAPGSPQNLRGSGSGNTLTVNWEPPARGGPIIKYFVGVGTAPGHYNTYYGSVGAVTSVFGTVASGTYYISVSATNASREGPAAAEISVVIGTNPTPPPIPTPCSAAAPSNLNAVVTGTTVAFTWSAPSTAVTGYVLEAGTAPGLSNVAVANLGGGTTYTATGVPPARYFVRVRSKNTCATSGVSNEVVVVVGSTPPVPTLVLTSSNVLRVRFHTHPPFTGYPFGDTPDRLEFMLAGLRNTTGSPRVTTSLFDGANSLGMVSGGMILHERGTDPLEGQYTVNFLSPTNRFVDRHFGTIVSFTSILSGAINGLLEVRIDTGSLVIVPTRTGSVLDAGVGVNLFVTAVQGSGMASPVWLTIDSITIGR